MVIAKNYKALSSNISAILVTTSFSLLKIDIPNVGDLASVKGGLPDFSIPSVPLNFETLKIIFPYAFILAQLD